MQYGRIANGSVTFEEASLDKEEVQTKALFGRSDNYPYQTLGGWNSLGRPDYVTKKENVSSSLLQAINRAFPEWRSADQEYRKRTDLYVKEDAQIWVACSIPAVCLIMYSDIFLTRGILRM